MKQNLIIWLATDGEMLRKNLGRSLPGDIAGSNFTEKKQEQGQSTTADSAVKTGVLVIVFALRAALTALPEGFTVRIFYQMTGFVQ